MKNPIPTAVAAIGLFLMTSCNMTQKMGANGVPDLKPPTDKEIFKAMAERGTNNWDFQMSKDGSLYSQPVPLNNKGDILYFRHDPSSGKTYAGHADMNALKNSTAQNPGEVELDPKKQHLNVGNYAFLMQCQQEGLSAAQKMPIGRHTRGPHTR